MRFGCTLTNTLSTCTALTIAGTVLAGSHTWRFNEFFSNEDGTIQFIEMVECCGGGNETLIGAKDVTSQDTGNSFIFPGNLMCSNCTSNAHLLLATQGFADLPGAPTPDYIIDAGFFDRTGDTLTYWQYAAATVTIGPVPTDGVMSLNEDGTTGKNSPTNFAGETGSVVVEGPCEGDLNGDNVVGQQDLGILLAAFNLDGGGDLDGDRDTDQSDLGILLGAFGTTCD